MGSVFQVPLFVIVSVWVSYSMSCIAIKESEVEVTYRTIACIISPVFDTVGGDTYKRSFKILKKGSGIIVSMLEHSNSELMNQYNVKAIFQFTQADREWLTKLAMGRSK